MKRLKQLAIVTLMCGSAAMAMEPSESLPETILALNEVQMYHLVGLYKDKSEAELRPIVTKIYANEERHKQYIKYLYENWDKSRTEYRALQDKLYAIFKSAESERNVHEIQRDCRKAMEKLNDFFNHTIKKYANFYAHDHNLPKVTV